MKVVADLQIHSKYSRAVSDRMHIEEIYRWALIKGIGLVATGDWTHPLWMREIQAKLTETGRGTLTLKKHERLNLEGSQGLTLSKTDHREPTTEFLLATEISSIYSQGGATRRVHNLVWAPSIAVAEKINKSLSSRGCNLGSDGRPIVGLSSIELCEVVFGIDETCMIIPAHAWTPWFAMYGSKSGFDSIDECFGPYADRIYAIETGLSSDPAMNWRIAELDSRSIVSFSDAHSGPKLGREATVFDIADVSYANIREAIRATQINQLTRSTRRVGGSGESVSSVYKKAELTELTENRIACTFEFYPEEGKYHWDGHRACNHRQTPGTTRKNGVTCPVCGKGLTVGVEYRVDQIASRDPIEPRVRIDKNGVAWRYHPEAKKPPFVSLVPLLEIISEAVGVGPHSKKVQEMYFNLIASVGDEFTILLKSPLKDITVQSEKRVADAVGKVRSGDIVVDPGYDGVFGTVKVWGDSEKDSVVSDPKEQLGLF